MSREEAQKRIQALNEPYKLEILERIKEEPITIYHIGKYYCLVSAYLSDACYLLLLNTDRWILCTYC